MATKDPVSKSPQSDLEIKTIEIIPIRCTVKHDGKKYPANQICELPVDVAAALINNGFAKSYDTVLLDAQAASDLPGVKIKTE